MPRRDALVLQQVIDQLANVLQGAIGLSTDLRQETQTAADDAVTLEGSLDRAARTLQRLHPPHTPKTGGGR